MSRRNHFDSGHGRDDYRFVHEGDSGSHIINVYHPSFSDKNPVSYVSYDTYDDDLVPGSAPSVEVSYLKSNQEGRGHARATMEHLYQKYPESNIDWGLIIHPASAKLAQQFEDNYYDRTTYRLDNEF